MSWDIKKRKDGPVAEEKMLLWRKSFCHCLCQKDPVTYSSGGEKAQKFSQVSVNCEHLIFLET